MRVSLRGVAGWAAILTTATFIAGSALMASSGVETLIPDTGRAAEDWVRQVDAGGTGFLVGGWLVVATGLLLTVALVGAYDAFRVAGPVMVLAPVLTVLAATLVTISHVVPLEMARHLVPGYVASHGPAHVGLAATVQGLAGVSQGLNLAGDTVLWGVVVPMYAVATLAHRVVPRWIGWLGLVAAVFGGWLGPVAVLVPAIDAVTGIGFVAFFVWMVALGVALLRPRKVAPVRTPAPA
jgi:hypothetical protein